MRLEMESQMINAEMLVRLCEQTGYFLYSESLLKLARAIWQVAQKEQRELDMKICKEESDSGFIFAEAIRARGETTPATLSSDPLPTSEASK